MSKLKKYISQTQCQIKSFKIQIKIFVIIISVLLLSCDYNKNKESKNGINYIDVEFDRFEKKFFNSSLDSLSKLIDEYPFLFSKRFSLDEWKAIKTDSTRKEIFNKTDSVFKNFKSVENGVKKIFTNTKNFFPNFKSPKLITLNNGIDYKYKIIDSDSIILISLDCYLGENIFYNNIPAHISKLMVPEFVTIDISELISSRYVEIPLDRKFISKIIYHGKLLFLMKEVSGIDPLKALGFNKNNKDWMIENENNVWKYFVENDLLFSTQSSLDYRFLANAPFSKFGLSIDFESPPMVGRWIGYQIVKSYSKKNKSNLNDLLNQDNYELYLKSNYKPNK
tara:strand:- start:575 stop:1585 length:1011 start_codon:yes stop_codon:yes gene_type:complete